MKRVDYLKECLATIIAQNRNTIAREGVIHNYVKKGVVDTSSLR